MFVGGDQAEAIQSSKQNYDFSGLKISAATDKVFKAGELDENGQPRERRQYDDDQPRERKQYDGQPRERKQYDGTAKPMAQSRFVENHVNDFETVTEKVRKTFPAKE